MMSHLNKVFFDLLIMGTLYQYSLGQILMAPIDELLEVTNPSGPISRTASLFQYSEKDANGKDHFLDRFLIFDPDLETKPLSSKLEGEFSSDAIEFCAYRAFEFEFFYRRSASDFIRLKCSFEDQGFVWRFYDPIYRFQNRGVVSYIYKMVRYFNDTGIVKPFVKQVMFYAKDVSESTGGAVAKTYSIVRDSSESKRIEPTLIFHSKSFAISRIHKNNKIALCLKDFPNERFLIGFSGQLDGKRFVRDHMPAEMQLKGLTCDYPAIDSFEEYLILDE